MKDGNAMGLRSWTAAAITAAALLGFGAAPALANAPNPVAGSTKLDSVVQNSDGTLTVTVEGRWDWATQTNCPQARNGVGYQVAWFDGNTANPIGDPSSPDGVIYVGDAQDNIVHSIESLGETDMTWDGVPSSYLQHNATNTTPTSADASAWLSNCDNVASDGTSSGIWGPISHTYPPGTKSITLCPIMYDPHGGRDNSGKSSVKDITAGGGGHNKDNSYEGNGTGANGNNCLKSTIDLTPSPSSTRSTPTPPAPTTSVQGKKVKRVKKHKKHVRSRRLSHRPVRARGFTG
jgi:hypothetical protein